MMGSVPPQSGSRSGSGDRPRRGSGPGRNRRPGDRPRRPAAAVPPPREADTRARPAPTGVEERQRSSFGSRLTGRAAVLVLVLAVLTVSFASSLKAYLQQRSHISDLKSQIAEREASIAELQREREKWSDPTYVREQARARFGYIMPGEKSYIVLDKDGRPLDAEATLADPAEVISTQPTAWWDQAWGSMELAGDPPPDEPPPAARIGGGGAASGRAGGR